MVVRALRRSDADEWQAVRARNHDWLRPWDATVPPGAAPRPSSYKVVTRSLLHQAKLGQCLPFVIEVGGRFAGQVTVSNVARGSAQWGSIGYWVAAEVAGRGVAPRAVGMVIDHCLGPVGLHRVEICVRPGEHQLPARGGEARSRAGGLRPALPAHRRGVARPPDLRGHRRGGP